MDLAEQTLELVLLVVGLAILAILFVMARDNSSGVVEGDEPQESSTIVITQEDLSVYTKNQLVILAVKADANLEERWLSRQTKPTLKNLLVGQVVPADFFGV
jgi:hypothetical protein